MKLWNKICGIMAFFLFFSIKSFGQTDSPGAKKITSSITSHVPIEFYANPIAPDFYTKNMGFFCKKELNLEKITKIPFRFRLGSLNYVNYLEGKKN